MAAMILAPSTRKSFLLISKFVNALMPVKPEVDAGRGCRRWEVMPEGMPEEILQKCR